MQTMVEFENICSVCFVSQFYYENFGAALNYQYQFNYKHFFIIGSVSLLFYAVSATMAI